MGVKALRSGRKPVTLKELKVVYRRNEAAFEQIAAAIIGDEEFGCEAVHDAFVQALRQRDRFRGDAPIDATLWRYVIGEARKRRTQVTRRRRTGVDAGIDRGSARRGPPGPASRARAGAGIGVHDPLPAKTPDDLVPLDPPPTRWESVIDAAETANRKRWRWLVPAVAVAGAAVAAGALALAWPFGGRAHGTVLERAAAAIGNGPVLHFVIRSGWGGALIDLNTGSRSYRYATDELWYEPGRGIHEVSRFAGVPQSDAMYSAGRFSYQDKTLGSLATRYRQALRDGSALVLGRDVVEGHPVYWIRVDREMVPDARNRVHTLAHDVAVSQETFEPVAARELRDGKPSPDGNSIVLDAESVPLDEGNFRHTPRDSSGPTQQIAWTGFLAPSQASAVLGRPALWAGRNIAGLELARIWKDERREGYDRKSGDWAQTYTGATFFYGTLDDNGSPVSPGNVTSVAAPVPFVQVSESRTLDSGFQRVVVNYSPPEGSILVFDDAIAVMHKDGLYVALEASSERLLLKAARALVRVPITRPTFDSTLPSS
jgi:DNA-directed RNA polymerase specialized sigma24 family protein